MANGDKVGQRWCKVIVVSILISMKIYENYENDKASKFLELKSIIHNSGKANLIDFRAQKILLLKIILLLLPKFHLSE